MLVHTAVLLCGLGVAWSLKLDVILHGHNGLKFSVKDQGKLRNLTVQYVINEGEYPGHLILGKLSDYGYWELVDENAKAQAGDDVTYITNTHSDGKWTSHGPYHAQLQTYFPAKPKRATVVFRDDYNSWNPHNYDVEVSAWGGGNGEFQVYTPESRNIFVRNGVLYLKPTYTADRFGQDFLYHGTLDLNNIYHTCTQSANSGCYKVGHTNGEIINPIMSGKVTTHSSIRYGQVKVRAKIPAGSWIWPAIWLLPKDWHYGGWPRSGEIDMMESRGNAVVEQGGTNRGVNHVASTLHWGPDASHNGFMKTHAEKFSNTYHGWHEYRLDWTADHIVTYVDNQVIMWINTPGNSYWGYGGFSGNNIWANGGRDAPFDQAFRLILNVAVGGAYFPDNAHYDTHKPWHGGSHQMKDFWEARQTWQGTWHGDDVALQVDYVELTQA